MMPRLLKDWKDSSTATVGELIAKLSKYPQDMAVAYTWEGQILPVVLEEISVMGETSKVYGPIVLMNAET